MKSVSSIPSTGNVLSRVTAALSKSLDVQSIVSSNTPQSILNNGAVSLSGAAAAAAAAGCGSAAGAGGGTASGGEAGTAAANGRPGRRVLSKVHSLHNLLYHQQQKQQQQQQQQQLQSSGGAAPGAASASPAGPAAATASATASAAAATAKGAAAAISSFFIGQGQQWDARLLRARSSAVDVELSAHSALPTYSSGLPMASAGRRTSGALAKASVLAEVSAAAAASPPGASNAGSGATVPSPGGADAAGCGLAAGAGGVYDATVMLMRATSGSAAQHTTSLAANVSMLEPLPDHRELSLPLLKIARGLPLPSLPLLFVTPLPEDDVAPPAPPNGTGPMPGTPMRTRRGSTILVPMPPGSPVCTPTSPFSPMSDQASYGVSGVGVVGSGMGVEGRKPSGTLLGSALAPMPPGGTGSASLTAAGAMSNRFRRAFRVIPATYDPTTQQPASPATPDAGQA